MLVLYGLVNTTVILAVDILTTIVCFLLQMLALSCLDSIIALDSSSHQVLRFITAHGYMRHLVESLVSLGDVKHLKRVTVKSC